MKNNSFSSLTPYLQTYIDSTSLTAFKECPRKYQLSIIQGYVPWEESVHLTWGLLIHSAIEHYHHLKCKSLDHEKALEEVVWTLLKKTWHSGRPWTSNHSVKNRWTLLRTTVDYLDRFGPSDPIETLVLSNGKPAVELSFRYDTGYRTRLGEPFISCGHFDRIGLLHSEPWIVDFKSTQHSLDRRFFAHFTPDQQMSNYSTAGKVAFQTPVKGIIIDGCRVGVTFSEFEREPIPRSDWQLQQWHQDLGYYLQQLEHCAISFAEAPWPQNDKSCNNYGGCPYREVCSQASPSSQQLVLDKFFKRRVWDPTQVRGDI